MVILTDERSASASEIVAGALQDHDRALVVGQTSFGKGLVQGVYNLDGGYALKLTTGKWFTPSGRTIQRPRKFVNGQFVEEQPDTSETNVTQENAAGVQVGRRAHGVRRRRNHAGRHRAGRHAHDDRAAVHQARRAEEPGLLHRSR